MELSIRLKTVAEAVTKGNRVADVGTDHGYVPIYLVKNNLSPAGIAMDVNKGPLEKAQEHIREEKLGGKIATRLGNGLAPLEPGETDTVIIAGMGGDLICKILKAKPEFLIEGKEFILQPQSEWFKIRRLLKEYRYQIEKEWFLKEDGKYYVIIKAEPAWTQPQRLKHQQPSIHEYIKEISDTQVNQAVSEKDMESIYEQYGKYLIETKNPVLKRIPRKRNHQKRKYSSRAETVHKRDRIRRTFRKREGKYCEKTAKISGNPKRDKGYEKSDWIKEKYVSRLPCTYRIQQ